MQNINDLPQQFTLSNNELIKVSSPDQSLKAWLEAYFKVEVSSAQSSRREAFRDISYFIDYFIRETGTDDPKFWTPRLSADFKTAIRNTLNEKGNRRWNDRSINRMLAHLKTFAKWIHKLKPFALGNPMEKIKTIGTASLLSIDRAITKQERRQLLDAADQLIKSGGISKDRNRYKNVENRPIRKGYRPYRNRAIVYLLIETGMRRAAVTKLNIDSIDFKKKIVTADEKGGVAHAYSVSKEGLQAVSDYLNLERNIDAVSYNSNALFLPSHSSQNRTGRLHPNAINEIWEQICKSANVENKTPHSARHAMGRHIIEKTGNIAAVQRQLGHKNPTYSMQYSRVTAEELDKVLNDR